MQPLNVSLYYRLLVHMEFILIGYPEGSLNPEDLFNPERNFSHFRHNIMHILLSAVQAVVSGRGQHLGIGITWSLRWRPDGAFLEEIKGRELGFEWGFDGGDNSSCWEVGTPTYLIVFHYKNQLALQSL